KEAIYIVKGGFSALSKLRVYCQDEEVLQDNKLSISDNIFVILFAKLLFKLIG
ncbi:hypothetical protein ACJX0J_008757, partial [Zea mays]